MLIEKVQQILLKHKHSKPKIRPWTMTQLHAALDISYPALRDLIDRGASEDIKRIAGGLGVDPAQLS